MERNVSWPVATLLIVAIAIVIGVVGAAIFSPGPPAQSNAAVADAGPAPSIPAPIEHLPSVLLRASGNGIKSTPIFVAPEEWTLEYRYNCDSFGYPGNFAIIIQAGDGGGFPDVAANELGKAGSDIQYLHSGGKVYLEINSTCTWSVVAKG